MLHVAKPVSQSNCTELISDMDSGDVKNLGFGWTASTKVILYLKLILLHKLDVETLCKELHPKHESETGV